MEGRVGFDLLVTQEILACNQPACCTVLLLLPFIAYKLNFEVFPNGVIWFSILISIEG